MHEPEHRCLVTTDECVGALTMHHEPYKSDTGNWHDRESVVLCEKHHQHPLVGRHAMQKEDFENLYKVDIDDAKRRLQEIYDDRKEWSFAP